MQPGVGNPISPQGTYTLAEMSERTLQVLRKRRDIACVLVNPLQALHPNPTRPPIPRWSTARAAAQFDRAAYTNGCEQLRRSAPSATSS